MSDVYTFHPGTTPLLVSVPHDGWRIPNGIVQEMTDVARGIPDTDWHVAQLYGFASNLGASMLVANFSRYVIDLNRPADDTALYADRPATGLVPLRTFSGAAIYAGGRDIDVRARIERYWQPYHERLAAALDSLRKRHGYALLWDAHSIPGRVPALFDGELPVLNLGTFEGRSCGADIAAEVERVAAASPYDAVSNARFKGGYITRHYGRPDDDVHAIQLELAQHAYMNEKTLEYDRERAAVLQLTLEALLRGFMDAAANS
jgi:N-formylglutamate amidohydrolase